MRKIIVLTIILMAYAHEAVAAFPLKTDDTGTEGKAQGEIRVTGNYEHDDSDGWESSTTKPNAVLTYGLSDTIDFGIGQSYKIKRKKTDGQLLKVDGLADTEVELKWRVYEWNNLSFALRPSLTLPTADDTKGLGSERVTAALFLLGTIEAEPWAFHLNAGYERNENRADERVPLWHFSTAAEFKLNNELKLAGEVGIDRNSVECSSAHPAYATVGARYSLAENINFRLGLRCGLNSVATDYTVLTGIAFKF
jgi:hypothetical protein